MSNIKEARRPYTPDFKEYVLKRLESSTGDTVTSLAQELGISRTAIYTWRRAKNNGLDSRKPNKRLGSEDKYHIVVETSSLNEQELSAYCRRKGLFVEDVKAWREQCKRANAFHTKDPLKLEEDLKEGEKRIKALEREVRRKDKALAETAALLVLRKKAQAIWEDHEEG